MQSLTHYLDKLDITIVYIYPRKASVLGPKRKKNCKSTYEDRSVE